MMNGLSTLNRLLGKKNKNASKSTSNLSRSISNLDTSSQYNKIVPLAAMNNAPFEQTFRITVLLPKDQLYVTRVGAKTKLCQLMELICEDKQLDSLKFEFRHPTDFTQGFDNEMTIGEVGLNEIRLVSKTEIHNEINRLNTSDLFRYQRNNIRESSLSSSDLSRNSAKVSTIMKTTSPYSSTNSLNSMDSSGMSTNSKGHHHHHPHPPVVPMRKKRMAPRPPSQNSIPEQEIVAITTNNNNIFKEPQLPPYSRKNFHTSTPNLYVNNGLSLHKNGVETFDGDDSLNNNNNNNNEINDKIEEMNYLNSKTAFNNLKNRPTSMYIIREPAEDMINGNNEDNSTNTNESNVGGSLVVDPIINHSRTSSNASEITTASSVVERPVPRKRLFSSTGKKAKAPAPPPRHNSRLHSDHTEIAPTPSPRAFTRSMTDLSRECDTVISETDSNFSEDHHDIHKQKEIKMNGHSNISKVMLNVQENGKVEEEENQPVSIQILSKNNSEESENDDTTSPKVSKVHIVPEISSISSSDEDDKIKVYNIEKAEAKIITPNSNIEEENEESEVKEEKEWTYTLPAPPIFQDNSVKSSGYDDKRIYDATTDIMEVTTVRSDPLTSHLEGDLEVIRPVIKDRGLMDDLSSTVSPTNTLIDSEVSGNGEILINSDIEDGYRGKEEKSVRETLLMTLEKRREKIIDSEFEFLSNEMDDDDDFEDERNLNNEDDALEEHNLKYNGKIENTVEYNGKIKNTIENKIEFNSKMENTVVEIVEHNLKIEPNLNEKSEIIENCDVKSAKIVEKHTETIILMKKSDVMNELNDFISENKTLINNQKNLIEKNTNSLGNFKITTYNNENKENIEDDFLVKRKISSDEDESQYKNRKEVAPVKRRSLTVLNKSPKIMNRSDSFHSTRSDYIQSLHSAKDLALTPRSTSYISLIGAQKWENKLLQSVITQNSRRKSTSEVSITDSPSLQSLEVIKNILNSPRKSVKPNEKIETIRISKRNSFTDISTLVQLKTDKIETEEVVLKKDEPKMEETVTEVVNFESKSDDEKLENKLKAEPKTTIVTITSNSMTANNETKKWKYEGRPTINLSTWSERPKIEVCIKSDKDYKFGGSSTLPRGYRNVTNGTTKVNLTATTTTIVHSEEDTVDNVSLPLKITNNDPKPETDRLPIVRSVEYKKNIKIPPTEPKPIVARQLEKSYFYDNFSRKTEKDEDSTITRRSFSVNESPIVTLKPVSNRFSYEPHRKIAEETPFSQSTLRRTGLKEKIMAAPKVEVKEKVVAPPPPPIAPKTTPIVRGVVVKKQSSSPVEVDPRTQLLDAIKAFNKDNLKK